MDILKEQYKGLEQDIQELQYTIMEKGYCQEVQEIQKRISEKEKWRDKAHKLEELEKEIEMLKELATLGEEVETEIEEAIQEKKELEGKIERELSFNGKYDAASAVVSINAGEGGDEACDWAEMLMRMYSLWAGKNGYKVRMLDRLDGSVAGVKKVEFEINGEYAYGNLKNEMGVHRLVRVSPFDAQGRRHTSFAAVEVIPQIEFKTEALIRPQDIEIQSFKSGGPGGQHQNKTESGVRIIHKPTGLVVECREERSQIQNKEKAMRKLEGALIALEEQKKNDELLGLKGEKSGNEWGSQIRSYIFMPYQMVRDERTGVKVGDVEGVLNGNSEELRLR